jgi:class I lanthipeptide synthase
MSGPSPYRSADVAMVRAARLPVDASHTWPNLADTSAGRVAWWRDWLEAKESDEEMAAAIEQASPVLARQVQAICTGEEVRPRQVRRAVVSVMRYLLRLEGRSTPFGLFAGVTAATFGPATATWGARHRDVLRADAAWLDDVITRLEASADLLRKLPLQSNGAVFERAGRLVVPYPPRPRREGTSPAEVTLRSTAPVRLVVEATRTPLHGAELLAKLRSEFPSAQSTQLDGLLTTLVRQGVLISALRAPAQVFDALDHVLTHLSAAGADDIPAVAEMTTRLRRIGRRMCAHHNAASQVVRHRVRQALRAEMQTLCDTTAQPTALDARLDGTITLPRHVAREAENAVSVLASLTPYPYGTAAWKSFHNRFFERYGIGSLVPVRDLVDPDIGLGFPAGYLDAEPEQPPGVTSRDRRLLALAQAAALDGRDQITLTDQLIEELALGDADRVALPPHLELRFQLAASSTSALDRGDYTLTVVSPSRGVGTTTGRFLDLLDHEERARFADVLHRLPVNDPGARPAQVSFSPLDWGDAHVTRAPDLFPDVISLAEHRASGSEVIAVEDLAVGCDPRRLYLASLSRGRRLEPLALHALDLRAHTPPLARFLLEVAKSTCAQITPFSWGPAATRLPYLPRVRKGRTILAPAQWRLDAADFPDRDATWQEWSDAAHRLIARRRVPHAVALTEGDQTLRLDLMREEHLALLRAHLVAAGHAVLVEAPPGDGWIGDRAHEVVLPMTATQVPAWQSAPPVSAARLVRRDHGHLPGTSRWLLAKLYARPERQPDILGHHLPGLLSQWEQPPTWWYMRYRDPREHLRLRVELAGPGDFAETAARIARWADKLRREGLVAELQFATSYPEIGRWGPGGGMEAARDVFVADSAALATAFAQPGRPHPQALAAANFVSMTTAFTGGTTNGMDWLIRHTKLTDPRPLDRAVHAETVRLANPADDWAALRAAPGGGAIHAAWAPRDRALTRYRELLRSTEDGTNPDTVLDSLLHAHHIRAAGIDKPDERTCLRLARAAALTWQARRG